MILHSFKVEYVGQKIRDLRHGARATCHGCMEKSASEIASGSGSSALAVACQLYIL